MGDVVVLAVGRHDESCLPVLLRDGPSGRRAFYRGMTKIVTMSMHISIHIHGEPALVGSP